MCCAWFFSGHVLGLGLLGETKYAALSCLPVDLFCVSADWIAFLFKSFLILTKTIAVLWCQGIPEVTGTLYILWFTARFASWKPQLVLDHFPCLFGLVMPHQLPQTMTGLGIFSPGALVVDFRQGLQLIFPSAVLMLRTVSFKNLRSLFAGFPLSCTVSYPELLFACVFHLALLAVYEKRVRKT